VVRPEHGNEPACSMKFWKAEELVACGRGCLVR
jgi:hypothetical protein